MQISPIQQNNTSFRSSVDLINTSDEVDFEK